MNTTTCKTWTILTAFSMLSSLVLVTVSIRAQEDRDEETDEERVERPLSKNLVLPKDISGTTRRAVEEAIQVFESAREPNAHPRILRRAINKLVSAGEKLPESPIPNYYLGIAYQLKKDFKRARRVLEKALKLNPEFFEALVELGDVHVWTKDYEKSLEVYDKALAISPEYPLALERKTQSLMRLGRFQDASEVLEKAQQIQERPDFDSLQRLIQIEIRGPGWSKTYVAETKNYKVSTSISKAYAQKIANQAELIYKAYKTVFPKIRRTERKFAIWVHANRNAYIAAGNPRGAGAHYEPLVRKLVLFKYAKDSETFLVLNHEAFHQFLHDYLDVAPQWFNEGMADYFGAFELEFARGSRRRLVAKPNPWRIGLIQRAIRYNRCQPTEELMIMSHSEMYSSDSISVNYAQAWGIIYFIYEGGRKQGYDKLLGGYFRALRNGHDLEKAYKGSFGKLNMKKFDRQWKGFIAKVK